MPPETLTQENRFLIINTPLGEDKLLLRSFSGQEGISQLFNFQLDLLSESSNINFDQIIGQNVTFSVVLADENKQRYFNGFVSRFTQLPPEDRLARYQAEVVPWLWFLSCTADCLIFQNLSVPDIIQQVFRSFGFSDFELQLRGDHQPWEYCVQYRETALNFVMRLMEQEGIFFFFKHENGKHTLVLADAPTAHKPCPEQSRVKYEYVGGSRSEEDSINSWRVEQRVRPGKYAIKEYYFETPSNSLLATIKGRVNQNGSDKYEIFDYPGEYEKRAEGDAWVRLRMEEEEVSHKMINGGSDCRSFVSGFRFDLREHDRRDQNGTYVLTSVTHSAHQPIDYAGGGGEGGGEGFAYSNLFTCIPHAVVYRAARVTPKPLMQGSQTAVVVGPSGEEIYTDKYGRVKVQFHWDRVGKRDENSSCWIRVSHPWAGKGWGSVSIPRIGQEVIVDFLEGDPDRPIITGRVYNAECMPPYGLPAGKVVSGLKTNSTKGGGGYNEMSMDDTKGKEKITIHGQYDMGTTVEHDDTQTIHNNRTIGVDGTHTETIKKDTTIKITEGKYDHDVVANTAKYHVKGALTENYDDVQKTTVTKEIEIKSNTAHIYLTAAKEIKLVTGESMVQMLSDGTIKIHGVNIEIIGTKEVKMGVGAQNVTCNTQKVITSGAGITTTAIGVHELSGALIKIN